MHVELFIAIIIISGARGRDLKLSTTIGILEIVFSNRMVHSWNSLPEETVQKKLSSEHI